MLMVCKLLCSFYYIEFNNICLVFCVEWFMFYRLVIFLVFCSVVVFGYCVFILIILVVVKLVNVVFIGYRGLGLWGLKLVNGYVVRRFGNFE